MLHIRDDAFAQLGDTRPARPEGARARRPSSRSTASPTRAGGADGATARRIAAPGRGHVRRCRATSTSPAARPARASRLGARRPAAAHPRQHRPGRASSATSRARPTPANPARPSLYGHGLFGDAGEVDAGNVEAARQRAQRRVLRHRLVGMSDEDLPNALAHPAGPVEVPDAAPTARSRASSNFLYLGRADDQPEGFASNTAFQVDGAAADRHAPPLLRRQQPGRHHGRRADRASRPTSTARCSACRAMNYSTLLPAQRRLRPVRGRCLDHVLSGPSSSAR